MRARVGNRSLWHSRGPPPAYSCSPAAEQPLAGRALGRCGWQAEGEVAMAGGRAIEVMRLRTTAAGRRAIEAS
jgi:hypothetical protein